MDKPVKRPLNDHICLAAFYHIGKGDFTFMIYNLLTPTYEQSELQACSVTAVLQFYILLFIFN